MKSITSSENQIIKKVKALHTKKGRNEYGEYIIEGINLLTDALQNDQELSCVLFGQEFDFSKPPLSKLISEKLKDSICYSIDNKIMKSLSDTDTPQGVIGILKQKKYCVNDLFKMNRFLIIDRIQDPGNLGTIIRTADAFGISGIAIIKGTTDPFSMKTVRSTAGSIFHVPIVEIEDEISFFARLEKEKYDILVTHLHGNTFLNDVKLNEKATFVIGNEANGVSEGITNIATKLVKIPMKGKSESLNASVAAAIVMYKMMFE